MVVGELKMETDVAIIGGGPGGYIAAIRAADLGLDVTLIEERERFGGTCLLEGCIPSKTLISAVELLNAASEAKKIGLEFTDLKIDIGTLRKWTESVVNKLSSGVEFLIKKRNIQTIKGHARFENHNTLRVDGSGVIVQFKNAIIATGSEINKLPGNYDLPLWTSAEALTIPEIPRRLLIVGGGYIGLEIGLVYAGLGSKITVVEFHPSLLFGADEDMVQILIGCCRNKFDEILTESKVTNIEMSSGVFISTIEHNGESRKIETDRVMVAIGRKPNTHDINLENTKIILDKSGFIPINNECRTVEPNIFAIGDVTPGPMLAHKASREGKVAAEVIAGLPSAYDNRAIPAVVFTSPEIAWTGLTERDAIQRGIKYEKGVFPLSALGRAHTIGHTEGFAKILFNPETKILLGVSVVGINASELISEGTLAIEMGATLEDLTTTIHPHPTLSESIEEAAEVASGMPVHIFKPKQPK